MTGGNSSVGKSRLSMEMNKGCRDDGPMGRQLDEAPGFNIMAVFYCLLITC